MIDCWITIDTKNKTAERHGIDPSKGELLDDRRADTDDEEHERFIAVKFPAGKVWTGIGNPHRYYHASVTVYSLGQKKDGAYKATAVLEFKLGRKEKAP